MAPYKYKQGDRVRYHIGEKYGIGEIVGVATIPLPVLGCMYIVKDKFIYDHEVYPFDTFTCAECWLEEIPNNGVASTLES